MGLERYIDLNLSYTCFDDVISKMGNNTKKNYDSYIKNKSKRSKIHFEKKLENIIRS